MDTKTTPPKNAQNDNAGLSRALYTNKVGPLGVDIEQYRVSDTLFILPLKEWGITLQNLQENPGIGGSQPKVWVREAFIAFDYTVDFYVITFVVMT